MSDYIDNTTELRDELERYERLRADAAKYVQGAPDTDLRRAKAELVQVLERVIATIKADLQIGKGP